MIAIPLAAILASIILFVFSSYLVVRSKGQNRDLNWLWVYFLVSISFELLSGFFSNPQSSNYGLMNYFTPLEFVLICFTIAPWVSPKRMQSFVRSLCGLFIAGYFAIKLLGWESMDITILNTTTRSVEVFLLVLISLLVLRFLWQNKPGEFFRSYKSWFLFGILLYSFTAIIVFGTLVFTTESAQVTIAVLNAVLSLVKYLLFLYAVVLLNRQLWPAAQLKPELN